MDKVESKGDVLFVTPDLILPEAAQAQFYLDLAPLVNVDDAFDISSYESNQMNAYNYNNALWGLPLGGKLTLLAYQPETFNQLGLAYPDGTWDFSDFTNAVRSIYQVTEQPAFASFTETPLLVRALHDQDFTTDSIELLPDLNAPELIDLVNQFIMLDQDGVVVSYGRVGTNDQAPITIAKSSRLNTLSFDENTFWAFAPFSGGQAILDVEGFAVSSGTNQPELAYRLAVYMSQQFELIQFSGLDVPAYTLLSAK